MSYLPAILLMVLIFWFSSQPAEVSSSESSRVVAFVLGIWERLRGRALTPQEYISLSEWIHTPIRKLAHMTEYAALAWAIFIPAVCHRLEDLRRPWLYAVEGRRMRRRHIWDRALLWRIVVVSVLCVACYAATDEVHQLFVPGRSGKVTDVLVDTTGAVLGILGFLILRRLWLLGVKKW